MKSVLLGFVLETVVRSTFQPLCRANVGVRLAGPTLLGLQVNDETKKAEGNRANMATNKVRDETMVILIDDDLRCDRCSLKV
jgi:hypothetical protein